MLVDTCDLHPVDILNERETENSVAHSFGGNGWNLKMKPPIKPSEGKTQVYNLSNSNQTMSKFLKLGT